VQTHNMFDGRLQVYRRENSRYWQCSARVGGQRFRESTKEETLDRAKDVAEDWYLDLRGKTRRGEVIAKERTFRDAAAQFRREASALAETSRSENYVPYIEHKLDRHILPFFGDMPLSSVNRGAVQEYRLHRSEESKERIGRPPSRSTMLKEISYIRQVLKTAEGHGWLPFVPNLSMPYLTNGKVSRRAWFSPEEYKQLYEATRRRITEGKRPGWKSHYEDMHDFVLFMANTGLRPDEAMRLQFRDVKIEEDATTKQTILVIDVRGKTGVGYCKSTPNAVHPFKRLKERRAAQFAEGKDAAEPRELAPTDPVFAQFDRDMFNQILREEGLKTDRDGRPRTAYSLRHTYISMRLMEGANIHQVANNCRTSVEMIEKFYAAHIKDRLDASAINVQRAPAVKRRRKASAKHEQIDVSAD